MAKDALGRSFLIAPAILLPLGLLGLFSSSRKPRVGTAGARGMSRQRCSSATAGFARPHGAIDEVHRRDERGRNDFQLIVHGRAMHGFTHDVGAQAPGVAYHGPSDKRSFLAIKTFLVEIFGMERHLGNVEPPATPSRLDMQAPDRR
jgi:hypothetical protein